MECMPAIGVVIATFNSANVIGECLESLFASRGVKLYVVVVDNASSDATRDVIKAWASGNTPIKWRGDFPLPKIPAVPKPVPLVVRRPHDTEPAFAGLSLVEAPVNGGFACAVNLGLRALLACSGVDDFWILNPDCVVTPDAAALYLEEAAPNSYALLGCRTMYYEQAEHIQSDGGRINRWTATCSSLNNGRRSGSTALPDNLSLDYISGANMVASRAFVETAGPMIEDYFLYYEEVDWALRRGNLPLRLVPNAVVYHHGGTAIGTGSLMRRPSPFANYFNYRNRARFARRHMPLALPILTAKAIAKAMQLFLIGAREEARSILAGAFGLAPPVEVANRIPDPDARRLAFGRWA